MSAGPLRAAAAAAALLLAAAAARGDVTVTTSFGFDGRTVHGTVTPVRVELASSDKAPVRCRIEISMNSGMGGMGQGGVLRSADVFLGPGARKRVTIPVLSEGYGYNEVAIEIRTDRKTLLRHGVEYAEGKSARFSLGQPVNNQRGSIDPLAAVVGILGDPTNRAEWIGDTDRYNATTPTAMGLPRPGAVVTKLNWGARRLNPPGTPPASVPEVINVSTDAAPDSWLCYEGMDALLWVDPDPDSFPDASQVAAILEYAAHGGRLLVALTPRAKVAIESPLGRALPARAAGHDDVPAAKIVKALVGGSMAAGPPVPVARVGATRGSVRAALPDGRPLLVLESYGLGTIGVLTFDPRLLSEMSATQHAAFLRLVFGAAFHADASDVDYTSQGSDLEPILNHLRKRFLSPPSFAALLVGLLIYVLAIGPLDYVILKRKGKLRRTVITFPLIVGGFTLLAWGSSFLLFGASAGQVRVTWIDLATSPARDADVLRGTDLIGTYSPVGTTLKVGYDQPRGFLGPLWLAGGSYNTRDMAGSLDGSVVQGPDGRPAGAFDLPLRSHRTVQARFSGEVPTSLEASIQRSGGGRAIEIRNGFRVRVRDLVVVSGERMFFAGDMEPGGKALLPMEGPAWTPFGPDVRLPDPHAGEGLFASDSSGWRDRGGIQFVPADETDAENDAARVRMARAMQGASVGGLLSSSGFTTPRSRMLARHGVDLSTAIRGGRPLVMGWCEKDPLGTLPAGKNVRSTAVVVRRLLPADEEAR